jgi:phosphatidylinositol-3-phosphatase
MCRDAVFGSPLGSEPAVTGSIFRSGGRQPCLRVVKGRSWGQGVALGFSTPDPHAESGSLQVGTGFAGYSAQSVASGSDDKRGSRGASCETCGAPFDSDQRYCLDCGSRRGELPPAVAAQIAAFRDRDRGDAAGVITPVAAAGAAAAASADPAEAAAASGERKGPLAWMPSPRAAAVAVICMLGLGVVIGSATSQIAQSAGLQTIIVEIAEKPKPPPPEEEPVEVAEAPEPEPVEEAPAPVPVPIPIPEEPVEEPLPEEPLPEEPVEEVIPPELEEEEPLPEVKHLFVIMLGENGFEESFGETSPAPYLAKTLPEQGELLTNYYGVAPGKLSNQVALLSGQGPTAELVAECPSPTPVDITPGTVSAATEATTKQVEGNGCVFPAPVETLVGQLAEKKLKWKAYVEEAVPGTPEAPSCAKPFGLFHSLLDKPECQENVAGLPQLAKDLKAAKKTPTFSYIVPNRCHAGAVEPCEPGQPTGPVAAEPFLKEVVPEIVASKAYAEGGLLLITSSEAPQTGAVPDASSCCGSPAFQNLPPLPEEIPLEGIKKAGGGGKVGMVLLSSFVKPGSRNETTIANHFTLLLTIEELFELEKLGYANEPALLPFDTTVFNAGEEEESTGPEEEAAGKKGEPAGKKRPARG